MELILKRYSYTTQATLGRLFFINDKGEEHFLMFTLELTWSSNLPFKSCIPIGIYNLEEFYSPKRKTNVFRLHGGSVYKDKEEMKLHNGRRYQIQIHVGNTVDDVVGCIVVGNRLSVFSGNRFAVINSKNSFNQLKTIISAHNIDALIILDDVD